MTEKTFTEADPPIFWLFVKTLFNATIAEGEPKKLEHNDIKWITPREIPDYDFCPADVEILKRLTGNQW